MPSNTNNKEQKPLNYLDLKKFKEDNLGLIALDTLGKIATAVVKHSKEFKKNEISESFRYENWLKQKIEGLSFSEAMIELEVENQRLIKRESDARKNRDAMTQRDCEDCQKTRRDLLKIRESQQKIELLKSKEIKPKIVEPIIQKAEMKLDSSNRPLPPNFCQITCDANTKQIYNYLMGLSTTNNPKNGRPFMQKEDVEDLMKTHFSAFGFKPKFLRYYDLNITNHQKAEVRSFIFDFYDKFEGNSSGNKLKYCQLMIWAFKAFKDITPANLSKNMVPSKKPLAPVLKPYKP